ncbi:hypothetical protein DPEC_G00148350 [Dallia pectoralis]|uniref:Uncharacterized protein n=1 Tax=Dallia pectoralis TaxID=75939 RepID=A0ACC2GIX8_DALPE|nr:hypothetical protein DPEC_G00148350 [Dallia pectoralis]
MEDDTDFEEQLIEQVRRYSHLYVPYLTEYKDLTVTNNSWKEIAQTLGVEKHICRTKWKSLRDRYVRLRRKMKGGSGRPASGIKPQILTTLSWLSDFIKHKDNESNHLQAEDVDNSEDLEDDISSGSVQETGRPAVRRNVISERTRFNQRQQEAGETVDSFITALHSLSEHCGYGTMVREMIRDRLVAGLCDRALSEQLQLDPELTLDKAIACIYQSERVKKQQGLPEQTDTTNASASHVIGELSCCQQASQESVEELLDVDGAYKCVENSNPGGGKPHQCAYCGSGFQRVRDLKRHQQTHTDWISCSYTSGPILA